ncbi:Carbohydrate kinase [Prochlorococcus sp. MIT 0602]|nr:Carbohydrate kinase [Prochlorococcus sp. MIT 0602]KGG18417.1 Carbohydrate kinase [Prochlorococcus sp. MIT 0603]
MILINEIPSQIKERLIGCSIAGTSGTLMGCDYAGNALGKALPYFKKYIVKNKFLQEHSTNIPLPDGIGRAFHLINIFGEEILLRHQADWISGWLLDDWTWGEEGNNIKLGWDLLKKSWPKSFKKLSWLNALPKIVSSGKIIGKISSIRAKELNLPKKLQIIAGTTDSNAAVLATDAAASEGITILGSTIVIKRFAEFPLKGKGITNHLVAGQWLVGGASNAGCSVLKKFFNDKSLIELSRQINPESDSGLTLLPLLYKGERFPIDDPNLEPILEPRPVSDSLYLHGLLEGLARIEAQGWEKMKEMQLGKPTKIITIGGGAKNPQWRRIRERQIGIPIHSCSRQAAEGVARLAWKGII